MCVKRAKILQSQGSRVVMTSEPCNSGSNPPELRARAQMAKHLEERTGKNLARKEFQKEKKWTNSQSTTAFTSHPTLSSSPVHICPKC